MNLEKYLLAFLVFSVFVVTGVFMMQDINKNYAGIIQENISTSEFSGTYNTIDKMYNISQSQKDQVLGAELSSSGIVDSSYKGTFSAVRLITNTFDLIGNIINEVAVQVGIPSYFVKFALTALTIMIIFGIISMILRFK